MTTSSSSTIALSRNLRAVRFRAFPSVRTASVRPEGVGSGIPRTESDPALAVERALSDVDNFRRLRLFDKALEILHRSLEVDSELARPTL